MLRQQNAKPNLVTHQLSVNWSTLIKYYWHQDYIFMGQGPKLSGNGVSPLTFCFFPPEFGEPLSNQHQSIQLPTGISSRSYLSSLHVLG